MNWDIYFLNITKGVSLRSKCLSRKIGAVLTKDNAVISTGYNGPPKGVKHCNERTIDFYTKLNNLSIKDPDYKNISKWNKTDICPRRLFGYKSGEGLLLCQAGHAERNALIQAGRNGVSTFNSTLYCSANQICKDCSIELINTGVKRLVFLSGPEYDNYSGVILKESEIEIVRYDKQEVSDGL